MNLFPTQAMAIRLKTDRYFFTHLPEESGAKNVLRICRVSEAPLRARALYRLDSLASLFRPNRKPQPLLLVGKVA